MPKKKAQAKKSVEFFCEENTKQYVTASVDDLGFMEFAITFHDENCMSEVNVILKADDASELADWIKSVATRPSA